MSTSVGEDKTRLHIVVLYLEDAYRRGASMNQLSAQDCEQGAGRSTAGPLGLLQRIIASHTR